MVVPGLAVGVAIPGSFRLVVGDQENVYGAVPPEAEPFNRVLPPSHSVASTPLLATGKVETTRSITSCEVPHPLVALAVTA